MIVHCADTEIAPALEVPFGIHPFTDRGYAQTDFISLLNFEAITLITPANRLRRESRGGIVRFRSGLGWTSPLLFLVKLPPVIVRR